MEAWTLGTQVDISSMFHVPYYRLLVEQRRENLEAVGVTYG